MPGDATHATAGVGGPACRALGSDPVMMPSQNSTQGKVNQSPVESHFSGQLEEEASRAPLSPAALPLGAQSPGQPRGLPEPQCPEAGVSGQSGQVPCAASQVGRGWLPQGQRSAHLLVLLSQW